MTYTPAAICFCPTDYDDSEQNDRELRAWELWQLARSVSPFKLRLVIPCTTTRDLAFARKYLETEDSVPFLTNTSGEKEFGRPLPFVHDLMYWADWYCFDKDRCWIGVFNNDIMVTPLLMRRIAEYASLDTILIHRTDVDDMLTKGNARVDKASVDGWLFKNRPWRVATRSGRGVLFPNFMLGEPGWGYASTLWCAHRKFNQLHIDTEGMCYHVRHQGVWKQRKRLPRNKNRGLWYGQDLYAKLEQRTGLRMDEETGRAVPKE